MPLSTPEFFYFDLGNVLARFSYATGCRAVAALAGVPAEGLQEILYDGPVPLAYERGELSRPAFFAAFCERTGTAPDYARWQQAFSAIFELQEDVLALAAGLRAAGCRLGILSNTSDLHWEYCTTGAFARLGAIFTVSALSYRLRVMKPDPAIYAAAARLAGVPPQRIFFVDDREENVVGARAAGFDAVRFTAAAELRRELQNRGWAMMLRGHPS